MRIPLLDLPDRGLLPRLEGLQIDLRNPRQRGLEPRRRAFGGSRVGGDLDDAEGLYARGRDEMVIARLIGGVCGRVGRRRVGIYGDNVCDAASCIERAFEGDAGGCGGRQLDARIKPRQLQLRMSVRGESVASVTGPTRA